jgi:hypothetical protein
MTIIKKKKRIIPLIKKCSCGKLVKNHHFLCDDCWGLKEKRKHNKNSNKLIRQLKSARDRKYKMKIDEEKINEEIEEEFNDLIRNQMTNKQFWEYVSSWKDGDSMAEEMEGWDILTKKEAIEEIKELMKNIKCSYCGNILTADEIESHTSINELMWCDKCQIKLDRKGG